MTRAARQRVTRGPLRCANIRFNERSALTGMRTWSSLGAMGLLRAIQLRSLTAKLGLASLVLSRGVGCQSQTDHVRLEATTADAGAAGHAGAKQDPRPSGEGGNSSDASSSTPPGGSAGRGGTGGTGGIAGSAGADSGVGGAAGSGSGGAEETVCEPTLPESKCNLTSQCGCPSDQACYVIEASAARTSIECRKPDPAPAEPGSICMSPTGCAPGYGCIGNVSGNSRMGSVCTKLCTSANDSSCGAYNDCRRIDANNATAPGLFACTRLCDPLNPSTSGAPYARCGPGVACLAAGDGHTDCSADVGTGTQGAGCESPASCAPGYTCVDGSGTNSKSCVRYCHVGGASGECASGTCRSLNPKLHAASQEIGGCY